MNRHTLLISMAVLAAVLGSLGLGGVFSSTDPQSDGHETSATTMPVDVKHVFPVRERAFDAIGTAYLRVDERFVDEESFCEFCIGVEYKPGPHGKATVGLSSERPLDLGGAAVMTFAARAETPGQEMRILAAGIENMAGGDTSPGGLDARFLIDKNITLTDEWVAYEVQLQGLDLKEITHGFAFEIISNHDERQVVYVDSIFYDNKSSQYATLLN
jgi:hypothetical protein